MIVFVVLNYSLMLGLYLIHPLLGLFYIILSFLYLLIKKKDKLKLYIISIILFSFSFVVINKEVKKEGTYIGIVIDVSENYYIFNSELSSYYIYEKSNNKEIGDILKIEGKIEKINFTNYESNFNFEDYLAAKNVFYELDVKSEFIIVSSFIKIERMKDLLTNNLSSFYRMLLFSESSDVSNTVSELGIYSLLSSSGILVYFLMDFLKRILFRFIHNKKRIYLPYIIASPLIFLSSFKIGVIKALFSQFNKDILNKKFDRNSIYCIFLLIVLLINPYYFKTTSFIFSFILPYFIGYLNSAKNVFKNKELANSFFIQLLFLPASISVSNSYSIVSILLMLFFKKVFGFIYSISYILLFIPYSFILLNPFANLLIKILKLLNNISFKLNYDNLSIYFIILYYVIFLICLILFELNELKKGFIGVVILSSYIISISSTFSKYIDSYVAFINVSQGDSILIHDKNVDVLIDTGGSLYKDIGNDVLIPFFKRKGIKDLDYVFLSHNDYDHNGAFDTLFSNFIVKNYVIGSNFSFKDVGNLKFINLNKYGDNTLENDDSSVIKLEFYSKTYLFTGDISKSIEEKLVLYEDIKADILKVAHHGSSTSSSEEFLRKVNPEIAVISVGENNRYKHPSSDVINRLNKLDIKILRTDIEGTIIFNESRLNKLISFYKKKEDDF